MAKKPSFDDLLQQGVQDASKNVAVAKRNTENTALRMIIDEQLHLLKQCLAGLKEYREREERVNNILVKAGLLKQKLFTSVDDTSAPLGFRLEELN